MAQGFARLGHEVTIICRQSPKGRVPVKELAHMYGLTEPLSWVQLPQKVLGYSVDVHWRFALLALPIALWLRPDLAFARNYVFPWLSSKCGIPTVVESHTGPDNNTAPFLRLVEATRYPAFRLWVTISSRLADGYLSRGVPKDKLLVLPDAVDLDLFQRPTQLPPSPYPDGSPTVVYAGHLLEDYKGIPTILQAAALLPDLQFHLLGGQPHEVARQLERIQEMRLGNVTLHGLKPHAEVPPYLWHADVLLMPPSQHHPSAAWTSPVKLGEYLASGTPVVATSIPALRDWLTDEEVEFVPADAPDSMAAGIRRLLEDRTRADSLSQAGMKKSRELSYEHRAQAILKRIGPLNE
jgi:glycosyltransferase involved in cell wall biosynthesis